MKKQVYPNRKSTSDLPQQPRYAPRVGDVVRVPGLDDVFGVVDTADPAIVVLQNKAGRTFRVGRLALELVAAGEWKAA